MVRLVDERGAPCALHLAVRDATGEPILELQADSPEWWDFGVVTVLHTPDGRFCGTQFPSAAYAMRQLECYYPTASSPTARFEQLEAYVAPHTAGDLRKELLGDHSFSHPYLGVWATQRHSPHLAAVPVRSRSSRTQDDALRYEWHPANVLRPFVPHEMTDASEAESKVRELISQVHSARLTQAGLGPLPAHADTQLHGPAQGKHTPSLKRTGRHRREQGEIVERPVPSNPPPPDPPSLELLTAREHMKRGTMDEGGCTDGTKHSLPPEAQPPPKKKSRLKRCFNKEGSVVFLRPGVLEGEELLASPATALVVVGRRLGRPLPTGNSPRYIIARPLAGGPQEEWHASQLASVSDRMPGLYRAFKGSEEPQREELRSLIEQVIQEEQRRSTVPIEVKFAELVPGAVWSEVVRDKRSTA